MLLKNAARATVGRGTGFFIVALVECAQTVFWNPNRLT